MNLTNEVKFLLLFFLIVGLFSCNESNTIKFKFQANELQRSKNANMPLFSFKLYDLVKNKGYVPKSINLFGEVKLTKNQKRMKKEPVQEKLKIHVRKSKRLGTFYLTRLNDRYQKYFMEIDGQNYQIRFERSSDFFHECCGISRTINKVFFDDTNVEKKNQLFYQINVSIEDESTGNVQDDIIMAD